MESFVAILTVLKDFSPQLLAIAGLIWLGFNTTKVVQSNTEALTKLVFLHESLSHQGEQIMRRLDTLETLASRH